MNETGALRTSLYRWLKWSLAGLFIIICVALGYSIYVIPADSAGQSNMLPADPTGQLNTQPYPYYLYLPKAYKDDHAWPVFVGIHGSGGNGRSCWDWWQSYADNNGFILICPSLSDANGGWYQDDGERKVNAILNWVGLEYNLESRVFLAGFSAGAQFVQGFAFYYPLTVKAVAVLSPGDYYTPTQDARSIPFPVVIGDQDKVESLNATREFVFTLEQNNFNVEYHLLPGVGHSMTKETKSLTIDLFREVNVIE